MMGARAIRAILILLAASGNADAVAAVLEVGPGKPFAAPSLAIAAARDGDTVRVAPGVYVDCATIAQNGLTLEGTGETAMTGKTCAGKAILVVAGNNATIRGLTLSNAKVPDRNGAGIRAEGAALLVDKVRFLGNENGIVSANGPAISIRVRDSVFIGNGHCRPVCAHGIYAGHIAALIVETSRFLDQKEGHHIKSRANRTEVTGSDIQDGPTGTASYLIDISNGGAVRIEGNILRKGPLSANPLTAIFLGAEGDSNPSGPIVVRGNRFANDGTRTAVFVRALTNIPALLTGNTLTGAVIPLSGPGTVAR